jgi:hypothetical protein
MGHLSTLQTEQDGVVGSQIENLRCAAALDGARPLSQHALDDRLR